MAATLSEGIIELGNTENGDRRERSLRGHGSGSVDPRRCHEESGPQVRSSDRVRRRDPPPLPQLERLCGGGGHGRERLEFWP